MTARNDEYWMTEALTVAREGLQAGEVPIGAVAVHGEEVIGRAFTQEQGQRRLIVHADLLALEQADQVMGRRRRGQVRLYVTLEPCLMCLGAAMTAMIGTVVYALESQSDGAHSVALLWDERRAREAFPGYEMPEIRSNVLRDESLALLDDYVRIHRADDGYRRWVQQLVTAARQVT